MYTILVFYHFNKTGFCTDLHWIPFTQILNCSDPDKALAIWYNVCLTVVNRQAPSKRKRVKHPKLPPWLKKDIKETMAERDKLKGEKYFPECKKLNNLVKFLLRKKKRKKNTSKSSLSEMTVQHVWRALGVFTK